MNRPDPRTLQSGLVSNPAPMPSATCSRRRTARRAGRLSIVRMLAGQAGDGVTFISPEHEVGRVAGVFKLVGQSNEKRGPANAGETGGFAKLEKAKTGDTLTSGKQAHE